MTYRNCGLRLGAAAVFSLAMLAGCSSSTNASMDRTARVRQSLHAAGLNDITVSDDRTKGVMTLTGHVATDGDKAQADNLAKAVVGTEVVSNQIAVLPPGDEKQAKTVNSDLDKGIGDNLEAALIQGNLHKGVNYNVKNAVVTLTGEVRSQQLRTQVQAVASGIPNVQQVVNELQVKNQRATSSN